MCLYSVSEQCTGFGIWEIVIFWVVAWEFGKRVWRKSSYDKFLIGRKLLLTYKKYCSSVLGGIAFVEWPFAASFYLCWYRGQWLPLRSCDRLRVTKWRHGCLISLCPHHGPLNEGQLLSLFGRRENWGLERGKKSLSKVSELGQAGTGSRACLYILTAME